MAKQKQKTRTVYRTKQKTYPRRSNGSKKGYGSVIVGAAAGAGGQLLRRFIPSAAPYAQPAADLIAGHYGKNDTLTTIGGRAIGAMIANLGSGSGSTSSGSLIGGI